MALSGTGSPRAVGTRIGFDDLPDRVRDWIGSAFGDLIVEAEHAGGMSPGCATTLRTGREGRVFVKAVGRTLNPDTPDLFRLEGRVLRRLPPVSYRAALLEMYDDGDWVALVLEHAEGRHPDFGQRVTFEAVRRVVERQTNELTPPPLGLEIAPMSDSAKRWASRWNEMSKDPSRYLPEWVVDRFTDLHSRVTRLPDRLSAEALCHFDLRDDNIVVSPQGEVVLVDWGACRLGPSWVDPLFLGLQLPSPDAALAQACEVTPQGQEINVATFMTAFAGSQAWVASQPARPGLPTLASFAGADAQRWFEVARLAVERS